MGIQLQLLCRGSGLTRTAEVLSPHFGSGKFQPEVASWKKMVFAVKIEAFIQPLLKLQSHRDRPVYMGVQWVLASLHQFLLSSYLPQVYWLLWCFYQGVF